MQAQAQPSSLRTFQSRNPYNNQLIEEFPFISNEELTKKIEQSFEAFKIHRETSITSRCEKLLRLTSLLEENVEKYAQIITEEVGKPLATAKAEILKCAFHCKYYVANAEKILKTEIIQTESKRSQIEYHPVGPIFHIIPFNFPFFLTFKGGIPALLVGNTIIHRNSDSTPRTGKAIEELMVQAGFDKGEFLNVYTSQEQTELVLAHKYIRGVSFTGSTRAGRHIASVAGKYAKKSVMELGGSDPFIVLDDADIGKAVDLAISSRLFNCGQVCFAGKRFIIDNAVYEQFKEKLLEKLPNIKLGDPMKPETELGPLSRPDLLSNIERQVNEGVTKGAKLIYGGKRPEDPLLQGGNFYLPTVCEVDQENLLWNEEIFGPVFTLLSVNGEKEAVDIANDTDYGLGCVVVSSNLERAELLGKKIDSGFVFINSTVKSDSRLPSGGVKGSGFGRECAEFGAHEFANIKTVVINE